MALKKFSPFDTITIPHPPILLFGEPFTGKTSTGQTADDPCTLAFDEGFHRSRNRKDVLQPDCWDDITAIYTEPEFTRSKTLVVDTVGRVIDFLCLDVVEKNPKCGNKTSGMNKNGWGPVKTRFAMWLNHLRMLGKDVCLLAHEKTGEEAGESFAAADIAGGTYDHVLALCDIVGQIKFVGSKRVIRFAPVDGNVCKDPCGWGTIEVPDFNKEPRFLANLFNRARAELGHVDETYAKALVEVNEWRGRILAYTDAGQFDKVVLALPTMSPLVKAQVRVIIRDCATALQLAYSASEKRFQSIVAKEPAKEPEPATLPMTPSPEPTPATTGAA